MAHLISEKDRKARKPHRCDYCGAIIEKGEIYNRSFNIEGGVVYDWKSHKECQFIARELWDYIDPYDGMTEDDFQEGCRDFCLEFICPDCPEYDTECGECSQDNSYCVHKVYEKLQTHELKRERRAYYYAYTLRERVVTKK